MRGATTTIDQNIKLTFVKPSERPEPKPWIDVTLGTTLEEVENALIAADQARKLEWASPRVRRYDDGPTGTFTDDKTGIGIRVGGRITFNVQPPLRAVTLSEAKNPHARQE